MKEGRKERKRVVVCKPAVHSVSNIDDINASSTLPLTALSALQSPRKTVHTTFVRKNLH
jgi:hypothetical protein